MRDRVIRTREHGASCPAREAYLVRESCLDYFARRREGEREPFDGADAEMRQWATWARSCVASTGPE